jgi:hypothetical protein
MARYVAQLTSAAALSSGVAFGWVGYSTTVGLRLRRVQLGTIAGTSAPSSQQLQVGINITSSGTPSGGTAVTSSFKMNPAYATAANVLYTGWGTAPTLASYDAVSLAFNSQSGGDWPWEVPEDLWPSSAAGTAVGFAFVNRVNALPSGMSYVLTTEWEE